LSAAGCQLSAASGRDMLPNADCNVNSNISTEKYAFNEKGISVIICSIEPELSNQILESIEKTIGICYETLVFDNREKGWGICQVYNHCAKKAKFQYLCFIHEYIIITTQNWGKDMVEFADKTQNCGVIGFAGGTIVLKNFLLWGDGYPNNGRYRYYDAANGPGRVHSINELSLKYYNPENKNFAEVITLDGLFLFVRKEIWINNPFDEDRIKGFHFYDADFSFGAAQKYQNYVCMTADIYHFSGGTANKSFYENAMIFQKKWKTELSVIAGNQKNYFISEIAHSFSLCYNLIRHGYTIKECIKHTIEINGYIFFLLLLGFTLMEGIRKTIKYLALRIR
jgi:hypothetical protein